MKKILVTMFTMFTLIFMHYTAIASDKYHELKEKNYFQFEIANYKTTRQSGQTVTIHVRYAYKKDLPVNEYPDYRVIRTTLLEYMKPSKDLPTNVYWEVIATKMGRDIMKKFPLRGLSIQLLVLDNQDKNAYEPGDHGPIFTIGKIDPINSF